MPFRAVPRMQIYHNLLVCRVPAALIIAYQIIKADYGNS